MEPYPHGAEWVEAVLPLLLLVLLAGYSGAVLVCRRRGRPWSVRRTLLWSGGTVLGLTALVGPLAELGHHSFSIHMVGHLLLGMLSPLLLVRAAPLTLALRALPTGSARVLVRLLGSRLVRTVSHPLVCGTVGLLGLWLLYPTGLFALSQHTPWLHLVVHLHVLAFGYLFTAALVGVDPDRHRSSLGVRSLALVLFAAGHAVLAKYLYGHPPLGVSRDQAEQGSMVMYYGGDVAELAVIVLLCSAWYAASAPRTTGSRRATTG